MVADETNTVSLASVSTTPSLPNITVSVWAALRTTQMTISAPLAASAGVLAPLPPSETKRPIKSAETSQPVTSKPLRLSEVAMPKPIEPSPIMAMRGFEDSDMWRFPGFLVTAILAAARPLGITAWPRCQSVRQGGNGHQRYKNPRG